VKIQDNAQYAVNSFYKEHRIEIATVIAVTKAPEPAEACEICFLRLPPCPASNSSPYPFPTSWFTRPLPPL